MKLRIGLALVLLLAALLGIGCAPSDEDSTPTPVVPPRSSSIDEEINFYHDDVHGVSCWIWLPAGFLGKGGFQCIPDWQLTPRPES